MFRNFMLLRCFSRLRNPSSRFTRSPILWVMGCESRPGSDGCEPWWLPQWLQIDGQRAGPVGSRLHLVGYASHGGRSEGLVMMPWGAVGGGAGWGMGRVCAWVRVGGCGGGGGPAASKPLCNVFKNELLLDDFSRLRIKGSVVARGPALEATGP